ncbi:hypothetical protein FHS61_000605 [Altererythrobacter atlanticus]|uniref:Uncharacterized protein n=1 Tax=Croceibacterium atlanticum TaxID=1267766 RepID=A0A0F7KU79_9SPHN|nr:sulfotransferase family protein [Croceibacterium atlanticum]AKH42832.1 hypothetical protein WYH_01796 [Croceibacterium atlanticum]MBB5731612.1 hypothetical protein [Croceibacterium atlanticum]
MSYAAEMKNDDFVMPPEGGRKPESPPAGQTGVARRKVFGVGLNKTGTTSLAACMEKLGYRHMGYRLDLLKAYRSGQMDEVWAVIDAHDSFDDWPYPLMYRELAERYPDAQFLLTIRRSPEIWFDSLARHSRQSRPFRNARKLAYGWRYPENAREQHLEFYRRHNAEVQEYLGNRVKVLCWETGDGWPELCDFIGAAVPEEAFPHANRSRPPSRAKRLANLCMRKAEAFGLL